MQRIFVMNQDMEVKQNEVLLIYDSNDHNDKKALGYAHSLKNHKVKDLDISKQKLTEQQFAELCQRMGIHPRELLDKNSSVYKDQLENTDLSKDDIFKMLKNNYELLQTPIVVYHDHAHFVGSGYDFLKQDMASKDIQSEELKHKESG